MTLRSASAAPNPRNGHTQYGAALKRERLTVSCGTGPIERCQWSRLEWTHDHHRDL